MDNLRDGVTPPSELEALRRELAEARRQQAAAAEVLRIVSRSAADAAPVFDAILDACLRLFSPYGAAIYLIDGDMVKGAARRGFADGDWGTDATPLAGSSTGRAIAERRPVHIADLAEVAGLPEDKRVAVRSYGGLTTLYAPMISGERGVGSLVVARRPKRPFSESEIAALAAFADQAVIAIENARLFRETQEALAQQTATADVLKTISRSAFDIQSVLDTLASRSAKLTAADLGILYLEQGEAFRVAAISDDQAEPEFIARLRQTPQRPGRTTAGARVLLTGEVQMIPDLRLDADYDPALFAVSSRRAVLSVPMKRDDRVIGGISLARREPGPFTARQIELVRTFADQAVIAVENARLFAEVQAKTRDLEASLERQTAMAEILEVISNSPTDAKPVFDAISLTAVRLFGCGMAGVFSVSGDTLIPVAAASPERLFRQDELSPPLPIDAQANFPSRAVVAKATVRCDFAAPGTPEHELHIKERFGMNGAVFLPLLRAQDCIGVFFLMADRSDAFNEADVALAESFRDQALIAVENARLFNETQEALAQQTATADVLKTISRSAFDLDAVFQTLVASAVDLCKASSGTLCVRDGDAFRYRGMAGPEVSGDLQRFLVAHPLITPTRDTIAGRTILSARVEEIHDVLREDGYAVPFAALDSPARALLGVPLIGKGRTQGAIVVARAAPGAFPPRQIEILKTFADQAVIAIENARLLAEVQARTRELEQSLADLRKAQDRLVQSEKLASLGQLTAGIAHEIKNPLNFVNNFAALSRDLLAEMKEALAQGESARAGVEELAGLIDSNLEKVVHHGQRADSIVKNMLLHSRQGSGERARVNVNAMVEEALNLAYHGARAEKPGFNVTLEKTLDPATGEAELYLQEITRVLLNLIGNGFYATAKRRETAGPDYQPTLKASTRSLGDRVEIRIRDNGAGIPDEVRAKMFNPFFTTKPAGEGTGLGLSLSHDIVVKQHGGTIEVETAPGAFAEFIVTLPRGFWCK